MHASLLYWLSAAWRKETTLAQDATAADRLQRTFASLGKQWQKRFDDTALKMGSYFATKVEDRVEGHLSQILKESGFTVAFRPSTSAKAAYAAVVGENVGLIKSIASEHLADVERLVMSSVATGRDLGTLTKALQHQYGVTRRRATLIATHQNNQATAVFSRQKQLELGIETARWRHSRGGRVPRPSHVAADGTIYEVAKGCMIDGEFILPGQLINCRCVSQPVIPGFVD